MLDQRLIQIQRPVRDRRPAKMIFDALTAVLAKLLAQRRIERDLIDTGGEVVREPRRIDRVERAYFELQIDQHARLARDRKSTRLNSSHVRISYAVFCLKK